MVEGLEAFKDIKTVMIKLFGNVERCNKELCIIEKELKVLGIIKDKFVWFENGKLYVGVRGDVEITLNKEDFDSEEECELLEEVLK